MIIIHIMVMIFLIWESYEDIRKQTLNVNHLLFFMGAGLIVRIFLIKTPVYEILTGLTAGLIVLFLGWISHEAIGYGDGMVILITGIYIGGKMTLYVCFLSIIVMTIVAIGLAIRKKIHLDMRMPFVPCILAGYIGGLLL